MSRITVTIDLSVEVPDSVVLTDDDIAELTTDLPMEQISFMGAEGDIKGALVTGYGTVNVERSDE